MSSYTGKADYLIKESGCGPFQALLVLFVDMLMKFAVVYTLMFMVFGNYNPGWRCMDLNTTTFYNGGDTFMNHSSQAFAVNHKSGNKTSHTFFFNSTGVNETSRQYNEDSCDLYTSCQNIEFNPDTSTIVTEWGLLCDKAWVPSFIISMQMAGMLAGALISGQLGDTFGRKKTLYIAMGLLCVLSLAAQVSTYWQVFTVIRFFMGVTTACVDNLYNILPAEYLNSTWRVRLAAFPSWHIGGLLFCIAALVCKDWKVLHLIIGVYGLFACIPVIWVPESLRWLEVKNKSEEFEKVAKKMMTMNGKSVPSDDSLDHITFSTNYGKSENDHERKHRVYTVVDLFRKNYRLHTVIVAFIWLIPTLSYYAISYGVKAMYGDFYINLLILFSADVPYSFIPMFLPNLIGRKKASMLFLTISAIALLAATGIGIWASADLKITSMFLLALLAKNNFIASMSCSLVLSAEIYPTVVRGSALGYCNFMGRVGGIIAPLLIPSDSQNLHVYYGIMGTLCLLCCLLMTKLPETKGKNLKEVFEDEAIN